MKTFKTRLYKSFPCTKMDVPFDLNEFCKLLETAAECGFQGVEIYERYEREPGWKFDLKRAIAMRHAAESLQLRIHSISRGSSKINMPDWFDRTVAEIKQVICQTAACGADVLLWIPCRIPIVVDPFSEFKIEFDPKTCLIKSMRDKHNTSYEEYIKLHNEATELSCRAIELLEPVAAREGVTIALENVGNNLWIRSDLVRAFIDRIGSHWVAAYYDMGNNVKYESPEKAFRTLGAKRITCLHIKDRIVDPTVQGSYRRPPIGFGAIDWISVRHTIEALGISTWVTPEDIRHYTPAEHSQILDAFFEGALTKERARHIRDYLGSGK